MFFPIKDYFPQVTISKHWEDWIWQEQNAIHTVSKLLDFFPNLREEAKDILRVSENYSRFKLTPYLLSLIRVNENLNPVDDDPIWNQFIPSWNISSNSTMISDFEENWELDEDMINPILQHKYTNRVNFKIQNSCLAYCMYCFQAKRILDKISKKGSFNENLFEDSLDYIRSRKEVREVVISGGEPLILSNTKLEYILRKIREINNIQPLRIQTRAFVHNPFRIDDDFLRLLVRYNITAIGIHISHPVEITHTFEEAIDKFSEHRCRTILLAHIPLLKGINDNEKILIELFMKLYDLKIKPYYLIHAMPQTLGSSKYRTSVRRGVQLLKSIKRHISNPAVPEYIIVHSKGKHTVPIELDSTPEFRYVNNKIKFLNWKDEWCTYDDVPDLCGQSKPKTTSEYHPHN